MSKTTRWWLAAPLALGLIVAACNGDDEATAAPETAEPTAAAEVTEAPAEEASAEEAPAEEAPAEEPTEESPAEEPTEAAPADDAEVEASVGLMSLGGEEIALASMLCFFEEQPRAGLGGVFTHTAQARGTNAEGEPIILDLSRARAEDGTVEDDVVVDIGDFTAEDAVSLRGTGPEGLISFEDGSVSGFDIEVTDFESEPLLLDFVVDCS